MLHPVEMDRRDLLVVGAAVAALWLAPPAIAASTDVFAADLAAFAGEVLRLAPEQATQLGVDNGRYASLKGELSDVSPAGDAAWAAEVTSIRQRLRSVDRNALGEADRIRYDTVLYAAERGVEATGFFYGGGAAAGFSGEALPYVVTQQYGAITSVPEFLNSMHQVHDIADAQAYLSRVSALARQLDQETARIRTNAARGVTPPHFIAVTTLGQLRNFRAVAAADQGLVTSLNARTTKASTPGPWAQRCQSIVEQKVYPALDRQIAAVEAASAEAPNVAGVRRLPEGEAFYAFALRLGTTTTQSPAEVHDIGLEQNRAIQARLDVLLKAQGLTQGTVGERLQALNKDPRFLFPDSDAGRAALIAYLNDCVFRIRPMMSQLSHLQLKAPVVVRRVPTDIQDGAALGYGTDESIDGSRPATYYINLKSMEAWPKFQLPTLTSHETIPGHTWAGAYLAEHHDEIPLLSSIMGFSFNAFSEGWALYAEQLVDEHGLYENDPFGEIGYLQAQQFRACRLVADTGLHAMNWTREQTINFLAAQTGRSRDAMASETDRYCVAPGQACGYKIGHNEILRLRERASTALGLRFDLAAFNDAVIKTGGVPLTVLATAIDAHIRRVSSQ